MDAGLVTTYFSCESTSMLVVPIHEFISLVKSAGEDVALGYVAVAVDCGYQIVTVNEFISLGNVISYGTALQYIRTLVKPRTDLRPDPLACFEFPKRSEVLSEPSTSVSLVEMPVPLTPSPSLVSRVSLSSKTVSDVLELKTKTGYCYSSILSVEAYDRRVRMLKAWPSIVSLLHVPYNDTIGINELENFYLKQVDHRGRFHLTTEVTCLSFLDTLYTLSYGYKQKSGSLGYFLSVGNSRECVDLVSGVCFSSRVGGVTRVDDDWYMRLAIDEASKSPVSSDKFSVGAVLVDMDTGEILSTGYSLELPSAVVDCGATHAEQCCFMKFARLSGLSMDFPEFGISDHVTRKLALYTTMEPCLNRKSGARSCANRICVLRNVIRVVYIGTKEPDKFFSDNSSESLLRNAGVVVRYMSHLATQCLEVAVRGH